MMKRIVSGLLALLLLVMCGCSGGSAQTNKNTMYVVDGAYNLTPQEYIELINSSIEGQNAGYPLIPDWDEDALYLAIDNRFIQLSLKINDKGKITDIHYHWEIKNQTQTDAAYFMAGLTIGMAVGAENSQSVYDALEMTKTGVSSHINECDKNGNHFYFISYGYGKYNDLHIYPIEKTE